MYRLEFQYWLSLAVFVWCAAAKSSGSVQGREGPENDDDDDGLPIPIYAIVLVALGGFGVTVLICIISCIFCYKKFGKNRLRKRGDIESQPLIAQTTKERKREEDYERHNAKAAVSHFVATTRQYEEVEALPDMGSRMQKYWFKAKSAATYESKSEIQRLVDNVMVLTITPISRHCPLLPLNKETVKKLNGLMGTLKQHQFIQPTEKIAYISERNQAIIVQPFMPSGSLKDMIYGVSPDHDWADKYPMCSEGKGLPAETVAIYGWQILKAMRFLYKQGFPVLGHVQSGNIFVQDGVCRVGGYENTLLGYRSRFYRMCKYHLEHMDVIMFGHLVFEMSCGSELITLAPTEEDYQAVRDDGVSELLQFIFATGFPYNIKAIKAHKFFQSVSKSEKEKTKFKSQQLLKEALTSVVSQLAYNKIWGAVKHGQEDAADKHSPPNQRR